MPEFGRIDADTVGMLSTACRKDDMQAASENIKTQALRERRSPVTCPRSAGVSAAGLRKHLSGLSISSFLALNVGWFGNGSEGDALASDLPQICRRFCGRSSEAAIRSFDIEFFGPDFGLYITVHVCVVF